ncbi:MAG: type II toxin-antitoxin system RelE/ParE family toxin [Saccharofermentanales bacterium]
MIIDFANKETEKIWNGTKSLHLPHEIQIVARRKLRMMNNSYNINDLRIPPNNRLETLKGNRLGYYSIRINNQWRIIFKWNDGNCYNVEINDYH